MGTVKALHPAAMATGRYLGPATVTAAGGDLVQVDLDDSANRGPCRARNALANRSPLAVGEEVLVVGEPGAELYVIGRLAPAPAWARADDTGTATARLPLPGGGQASLEAADDGSRVLRVRSPTGALVIEYDPEGGRARVTPEAGDLELAAPSGSLVLRAAGAVAVEGGSVALRSRSGIGLVVEDTAGASRSILALEGDTARIVAPTLDVAARRASLQAEDARVTSRHLLAEAASLRVVAGHVQTLAKTVVAKAQNLYRTVEELCELRAGRVRALVDGTYHLKARDAVLRADRDVDVDGEKIRLG
jgi:hypothetical protein